MYQPNGKHLALKYENITLWYFVEMQFFSVVYHKIPISVKVKFDFTQNLRDFSQEDKLDAGLLY